MIQHVKKILATNVMVQTVVFATGRNQGLWLCAPLKNSKEKDGQSQLL